MILWLTAAAGLAALCLALPLQRGFTGFGALAAVFVLGNAGRLTLLRDVWFPSIDPTPVTPVVALGLAALLLQAVATAAILWRFRDRVIAVLGTPGVPLRLLGILAVLALLSLSPTPFVAYGGLTSYAARIVIGGALTVLQIATLGALLLVPGPSLPRLSARMQALAAAAIAVIASALLAVFAFEAIPHVGDDLTYLFQARTFAGGHLTVPAPPEALQPGLEYYLLDVRDGRWFGTTAPGWPALLALGVLAGVPWLVNPLLTGASVLLGHGLMRRATGSEPLANLTAWLMATSPWVLGTGGSYMTHTASLCLLLAAWFLLVAGGAIRDGQRGTPAVAAALAAGLCMGWLFSTRQFEGVVMGGLTGIALMTLRPLPWRAVISYGLGCLATGLVYFAFNWAITGNPLEAPLAAYLKEVWPDTSNAFGFGPDRGPPPGSWGALDFRAGHGPFEGAVNTVNGLASLNLEALGWATGSLLAALLLVFAPRRPRAAGTGVLALCFVAVVGTLAFYWFSGTFYTGPRYWYITAFPVLVASAAGILALADRAGTAPILRATALLCLCSLLVFTPWRGVAKYYQFRENYNGLSGTDFGSDLVFVTVDGDMEAALALNDPYLPADRPIFLRDLGPEANAAVAAAMPGRTTRRVRLDPDGWAPLE